MLRLGEEFSAKQSLIQTFHGTFLWSFLETSLFLVFQVMISSHAKKADPTLVFQSSHWGIK